MLCLQDLVCKKLFAKELRASETDRIIVDNIKWAIKVLSASTSSLAHRAEAGVLLAGCASSSVARLGDKTGTERRICERLEVPRGCRSAKLMHRPYAYRQGAVRRESLEIAHAQIALRGPEVGDTVFVGACNSTGKLIEVGDDGSCSIEFSLGDVSEVHQYKAMGLPQQPHTPGSARLRQILPLLSPPPRKTSSSSGALNGLAQRVEEHARSRCSESPHTRDSMSRRVAVFLHERKQALIKTEPVEEMYEDFHKNCALGQGCKLSTYKNYLPWNMKDAYRETCLCAHCESQRLHMEGMRVAADLLKPVVALAEQQRDADEEAAALQRQERQREAVVQAAAAAEAARQAASGEPDESVSRGGAAADEAALDGHADPAVDGEGGGGGGEDDTMHDGCADDGAGDDADLYLNEDASAEGVCSEEPAEGSDSEEFEALKRLTDFLGLKSKSAAVEALICGGDLPNANEACIKGTCGSCGFKQMWSNGYRRHVVDENGHLRASAARVWGHRVRWERLRAGIHDREEVCLRRRIAVCRACAHQCLLCVCRCTGDGAQ